jgi:hypothetical protein
MPRWKLNFFGSLKVYYNNAFNLKIRDIFMKKLLLILNIIIIACPSLSWAACNKWDVINADKAWQDAIGSNIAADVVALYAKNGVLLPTFGVKVIDTQAERFQYFSKLFREIDNLEVHFTGNRHIQFIEGGAVSSGDYVFVGEVAYDGEVVDTPARYTFVYDQIKHEDDADGCHLQLITHHSSEQPFGSKLTQLIQ